MTWEFKYDVILVFYDVIHYILNGHNFGSRRNSIIYFVLRKRFLKLTMFSLDVIIK